MLYCSEHDQKRGNLPMKHSDPKKVLLLLLAAIIWGSAFVAQSVGMDYVGPYTYLASRSYIGSAFLLGFLGTKHLLKPASQRPTDFVTGDKSSRSLLVKGGICAGCVLFVAAILQQIGILYTTVGKAGFLTAMYVIFVPFISLVLFRKRLPRVIWLCVGLAVVGMALLCLKESLVLSNGDTLVLLCAVAFSGHILVLDHFTPKVDPVRLSCIQFFICAIVSTVPMLMLEKPTFDILLAAAPSILYAGVLSSGVAYTLQAVAQEGCDPTIASLVMCLESVFSAVFGWMILGQALSVREIVGCCLMFAAIALAQLPDSNS